MTDVKIITYHDGNPNVFLQANKAATNVMRWSDDMTNGNYVISNGSVISEDEILFDVDSFSRFNQNTGIEHGVIGDTFYFRTMLKGAGTLNLEISTGGNTQIIRVPVTLTNEWTFYYAQVDIEVAAEEATINCGLIAIVSNTATTVFIKHYQCQKTPIQNYIPTTTAAVSIVATDYTFPQENIDPSDSLIEFDMDWEGD